MVKQGATSDTPQSGASWPFEGSTTTAVSAATTLWIHDAQNKKAVIAETAMLRWGLLNDVWWLSLLARKRRNTCMTRHTAATTSIQMAPKTTRFETKVLVLEFNACLSSFGCTERTGKAFPLMNVSGWGGARCEWNATARTIGAAFESNIWGAVEHDSSKGIVTLWMH
jgi:hypothetical protein